MPKRTIVMPEVDRVAANRAAVAARRARAELKRQLRSGEISLVKVLDFAQQAGHPAVSLRIMDYLLAFPAVGQVKAERIRAELHISARKRLGGLGMLQRQRLLEFAKERLGYNSKLPRLTVLAGPTAVGKGTVAQYVRDNYPEISLAISATTRAPRPGEVHGEHYYFVDDAGFDGMLARDELLEWATVHNRYRYGTPRSEIAAAAAAGKRLLLEIDLQGARQIRNTQPDARLVFLTPPTWDELVRRLENRGTENASEQAGRLNTAKIELAAANEFDEIIVNDEVPAAARQLVQLMQSDS